MFAKLDLCEFIYKKIFKKSHAIKWQETSENCKKHQKPSTTSLTPERTEKNTPGTHIMGRVPSSLTPTCDCMKVVINLAKSSLDICLFILKIFNPTILLVPDEKYDFARLVKFGDLEQQN